MPGDKGAARGSRVAGADGRAVESGSPKAGLQNRPCSHRLHTSPIGAVMTSKQTAIQVIDSLSDDVSLDEVIDRLYLLRKIELGLAQADAGDVMDHDLFMAELEREDAD